MTKTRRLTKNEKAARERLQPGSSLGTGAYQLYADLESATKATIYALRKAQAELAKQGEKKCDLFTENPSTKDGAARNSTEKQGEPKEQT